MKAFKKKNVAIILILFVASFLRLWKLNSIPPHLTSDEAALGYNAYSILKTGHDEYGEYLPIIFKSFGDYKPGFYIYLTIPFVFLLGLNEFSVRLPSALAGILAVWLVYQLVISTQLLIAKKEDRKESNLIINHQLLAIVASLLLALSPWHIHFSRGAWEANLSLTLTLFGIIFFLKSLQKPKFLYISTVFFSLTFLTYQGAKLSTLIVISVLIVSFWKEVKLLLYNKSVIFIFATLLSLIIISPIILSFFSGKTGRLKIFSIFSYARPENYLQSFLEEGGEKVGSLNYYLFHSEVLNFARGIMGRWFNHFSGRFLFFEGDYQNPRHSAPYQGMLLLFDLILILPGFMYLFKNKSNFSIFIFLWLILAPLPAALSRDQVHAVRSLNLVIPLVLVSSFGFSSLFIRIKTFSRHSIRAASFAVFVLGFFASLIYYFDAYFIHLLRHYSKFWNWGYKEIVETITPIQENYKEIKVQQSFAQPYIYFLFYQKYDPVKYQEQAKLIESEYKGDVGYIEKLDNICFCVIDWPQVKNEHGILVVADDIKIPENELKSDSVNLIKEIKYLNGDTAFRIVEVK